MYFAVSCFAFISQTTNCQTTELNKHTHTHWSGWTTSYLQSSFLVFVTGQLEDLRLPWELALGHSPQLRLSSSKPWWLQQTVSPIPPHLLPSTFYQFILFQISLFLFISLVRVCVGRSGWFRFLFGWRVNSQAHSLIKLSVSTVMFPCSECVLHPVEVSDHFQTAHIATCRSSDQQHNWCVEFNNMTELKVFTVHTHHMCSVLL